MSSRTNTIRLVVVTLAALIATSHLARVRAQSDPWVPPYPMILTSQRAAALMEAAERRLDFVPWEVLVTFKEGVSVNGQQRALAALRSRPAASDIRWAGQVGILTDRLEWNAEILAAQLGQQPEVAYAEPNYLYRHHVTPNDPGFTDRQWNFEALDLPRAWDINAGGSAALTVAVVDTGITSINQTYPFATWNGTAIQNINVPFRANPDLGLARIVTPRDFVFWTGPVLDMHGHATHVSSTIAEDTNNNLAEAGIAYNVNIMPVKVCVGFWEVQFVGSGAGLRGYAPLDSGGCPTDAITQGIRYAADNGAKVINVSLGGARPSLTLQNALTYAVGKGAFVTISAGNSYEEDNPAEYPASYAADIDGVMSVGAVGRSLTRAYYSGTASRVEIAAPGGSTRDGGASGRVWQTTISGADSDAATVVFPRFDRYVESGYQGTSMAAPHVAGTAALIMSQGVTDPAIVEALIKKTARDLGVPGRDDEYGYGLVQPRAALFGFGIAK